MFDGSLQEKVIKYLLLRVLLWHFCDRHWYGLHCLICKWKPGCSKRKTYWPVWTVWFERVIPCLYCKSLNLKTNIMKHLIIFFLLEHLVSKQWVKWHFFLQQSICNQHKTCLRFQQKMLLIKKKKSPLHIFAIVNNIHAHFHVLFVVIITL